MNTQGWKKLVGCFAAATIMSVISGCQIVGPGTPHPFASLRWTEEPVGHQYADQLNAPPLSDMTAQTTNGTTF